MGCLEIDDEPKVEILKKFHRIETISISFNYQLKRMFIFWWKMHLNLLLSKKSSVTIKRFETWIKYLDFLIYLCHCFTSSRIWRNLQTCSAIFTPFVYYSGKNQNHYEILSGKLVNESLRNFNSYSTLQSLSIQLFMTLKHLQLIDHLKWLHPKSKFVQKYFLLVLSFILQG